MACQKFTPSVVCDRYHWRMQATVQALADLIKTAGSDPARRPLRVRGGGSKDFYGEPLQGAVLDTGALNQVVAYEPTELVITAGAGLRLRDLEALLATHNQCLPCDPPHFGPDATIGGAVAAALSGPARASVGAMKDFVLGIKMLNAAGELLTFGGQVMKNVAGYDISRLMAGSMGTLGVLTEVSIKVLPVAPAEANLKFNCDQARALSLINTWGGQPLPLNASVWKRDKSGRDSLVVRLRGAVAAVDAASARMASDAAGYGISCAHVTTAEAEALWLSCREQTHHFFTPPAADACLWRLSVAQTAPAMAAFSDALVEWHGALRWVWAPASDAEKVRQLAEDAGGHATLFRVSQAHGETDKTVGVFHPTPPATSGIAQRLREQLDPTGVFNTHRL
jgi:glycolate oxidase FAD binding subunit